MAIAKVWSIAHVCGHTVERDLSDKSPDKRAGFAKWLKDRDCTECFKEKNRDEFEQKRREEEAKELADAEVYEQRSGLDELSGTDKQVAWGRRIRVQVLAALYEQVEEGEKDEGWFEQTILQPARLIGTARWWIDNREFAAEDWPELLAAGAQSDDANENLAS